jgi:hypothetical protein
VQKIFVIFRNDFRLTEAVNLSRGFVKNFYFFVFVMIFFPKHKAFKGDF